MPKSIVTEGKTTTEAIEKGLRELNVTKDKVEIKILENEEKRSFFSILAPRIVKVELKLKENIEEKNNRNDFFDVNENDLKQASEKIDKFFSELFKTKELNNINYEIKIEEETVKIFISGEKASCLIGYRGETLNAIQLLASSVANKNLEKRCKILVDIEGYREKRKKSLEELAEKISKTVVKTKKSITLEPMSSYERKIIHSKLQGNKYVKTSSVGEEPHRKVIISLK